MMVADLPTIDETSDEVLDVVQADFGAVHAEDAGDGAHGACSRSVQCNIIFF